MLRAKLIITKDSTGEVIEKMEQREGKVIVGECEGRVTSCCQKYGKADICQWYENYIGIASRRARTSEAMEEKFNYWKEHLDEYKKQHKGLELKDKLETCTMKVLLLDGDKIIKSREYIEKY